MAFDEIDDLLREDLDDADDDAWSAAERPEVVIVDDDPSVRHALERLLGVSYVVKTAGSASDGVALVSDDTHAIVLDVKMPGRDGFWACDEIRRHHPEIPIIFYSAYQDVKDPYAVINQHRPFGYLVKDGGVLRLLETLAVAVGLQRIAIRNKRELDALRRQVHGGQRKT